MSTRMTGCPKCKTVAEIDKYGFLFCRRCNKYFTIKKRNGPKKRSERYQWSFVAESQVVVDNGV